MAWMVVECQPLNFSFRQQWTLQDLSKSPVLELWSLFKGLQYPGECLDSKSKLISTISALPMIAGAHAPTSALWQAAVLMGPEQHAHHLQEPGWLWGPCSLNTGDLHWGLMAYSGHGSADIVIKTAIVATCTSQSSFQGI